MDLRKGAAVDLRRGRAYLRVASEGGALTAGEKHLSISTIPRCHHHRR